MVKELFGERLKQLRLEGELTVRQLALKAEMSFSLLTLIENGHRGAGQELLERIGTALNLKGVALREFVLDGLSTSAKDGLLDTVRKFDPRINNMMALTLLKHGISPNSIKQCRLNVTLEPDLLLKLANQIQTKAKRVRQAISSSNVDQLAGGVSLEMILKNKRRVIVEVIVMEI